MPDRSLPTAIRAGTTEGGGSLRAAFVSGASSGIGFAVARALLLAGYAVTATARRAGKLSAAAEQLAEHGEVHEVVADFRDGASIESAIEAHAGQFGRLDVLVNNAGVGVGTPLVGTSVKAVDLALAVNLRSAVLCSRAAAGLLVDSAPSYVVNMSSITGLKPEANMAAYAATKAGLIAFSEAFGREYAASGVRSTAICPAFVDTAMADGVRDHVAPAQLIGVEDVTEIVLTLLRLSPGCSVPVVPMESPHGGLQGWTESVAADG